MVEQRLARLRLVALAVAGREEALVAPPHVHARPVDGVARGVARERGQARDPDGPTRQHDVHGPADRLHVEQAGHEPRRHRLGEHAGVGVHDDEARRGARPRGGHAPTFCRPLVSTSP